MFINKKKFTILVLLVFLQNSCNSNSANIKAAGEVDHLYYNEDNLEKNENNVKEIENYNKSKILVKFIIGVLLTGTLSTVIYKSFFEESTIQEEPEGPEKQEISTFKESPIQKEPEWPEWPEKQEISTNSQYIKLDDDESITIFNPTKFIDKSFNTTNKYKIESLRELFGFFYNNRTNVKFNIKYAKGIGSVSEGERYDFLLEIYKNIDIKKLISYETFKSVITCCTGLFMKEDPVILIENNDIESVRFIGDFHGVFSKQFENVIDTLGENDTNIVVFTGDYIHRALNQVEVIFFIAYLKILFPDRVYVLLGNHELTSSQGWGIGACGSIINFNVELITKYPGKFDDFSFPNYLTAERNFLTDFLFSLSSALVIKKQDEFILAFHAFPIHFINKTKDIPDFICFFNDVLSKKQEIKLVNVGSKKQEIKLVNVGSKTKKFLQFQNLIKYVDSAKKYNGNAKFESDEYKSIDFFYWDNCTSKNNVPDSNSTRDIFIKDAVETMEKYKISFIFHGHQHYEPLDKFGNNIITVNSFFSVKPKPGKAMEKFGSCLLNLESKEIKFDLNYFTDET